MSSAADVERSASETALRAFAIVSLIGGTAGLVTAGEMLRTSLAGSPLASRLTPVWAVLNLLGWVIVSRELWRRAAGRTFGRERFYAWIYCAVLNMFWFQKAWVAPSALHPSLRASLVAATLGAVIAAGIGFCLESLKPKR
jgi:hypothetical protein